MLLLLLLGVFRVSCEPIRRSRHIVTGATVLARRVAANCRIGSVAARPGTTVTGIVTGTNVRGIRRRWSGSAKERVSEGFNWFDSLLRVIDQHVLNEILETFVVLLRVTGMIESATVGTSAIDAENVLQLFLAGIDVVVLEEIRLKIVKESNDYAMYSCN